MNAMEIGGNEDPFEVPEIYPYVRMYPYVHNYPNRKSNPCFSRSEPEDIITKKELGNGEKEEVSGACPGPGEVAGFVWTAESSFLVISCSASCRYLLG
jgi:hypothetical protein